MLVRLLSLFISRHGHCPCLHRGCRPHSHWQLQLQPFVVRVILVHVAAAAVVGSGGGRVEALEGGGTVVVVLCRCWCSQKME